MRGEYNSLEQVCPVCFWEHSRHSLARLAGPPSTATVGNQNDLRVGGSKTCPSMRLPRSVKKEYCNVIGRHLFCGSETMNLTISTIALLVVATLPLSCARRETAEQQGNTASSARVRTLDQSNFDAEVQNGVVLVDFWATWCGPCKMQAPIVEKVAGEVEGKASVAKLDVDA